MADCRCGLPMTVVVRELGGLRLASLGSLLPLALVLIRF
jgi:hypothetical protein